MMKRFAAAASIAVALATASPASAQMVVTDTGAYTRMLQQLREAQRQYQALQSQLQQAERLYEGLNTAVRDPNSIGRVLNNPIVRQSLPEGSAGALGGLLNGRSINDLGDIADRAEAIRESYRRFTPDGTRELTASERYYQDALEQSGNRAARDMAMGERVYDVSSQRLQGLEELRGAISTAPNARAVMDLEARIAAEQAFLQNELVRLQGLQMMQAAEERLDRQRALEEGKADRAAARSMFESMGVR